jgi:N-acetylmuramic acid 6-phosphate (MurNAc-6-P) etherase
MMLTELSYEDASEAYEAAGRSVKVAVVLQRRAVDRAGAEKLIAEADGFLARALGERS